MIAVLTADIIESTTLKDSSLEQILKALNSEFNELHRGIKDEDSKFKIYRGDSFQGVISEPETALQVVLRLKSALNRINLAESGENPKMADFRIAIGIGKYDFERSDLGEANGQAFRFSGQTLDEMKGGNRKIILKTPNEEINSEFNASLFLLDLLINRWSTASAEVIYYLLKGLKEVEISEILKISQPAVNQRKRAAGWEAVSVLLSRYQQVIKKKFGNE